MWDHAAGEAVLLAAGGCVTDIHGKKLDFSHGSKLEANTGIVASTVAMKEAVVNAICNLFSVCFHDSSLSSSVEFEVCAVFVVHCIGRSCLRPSRLVVCRSCSRLD